MSAPTIYPSESQILTAVRAFLIEIVPPGTQVVRRGNRVPEPGSALYIVMTPLFGSRLETNTDQTVDANPSGSGNPSGTLAVGTPTQETVQLDVHGPQEPIAGQPSAQSLARTIESLFRDEWGANQFAASGFPVAPLYCDEARQLPWSGDEQQVEQRWQMDLQLQMNYTVTTTQDFYVPPVKVGIINVDVVYPPGH
jgi:hypothetical protein